MKLLVIICSVLFLSAGAGLFQEIASAQSPSGALKLTISSTEPAYDLKNARVGSIVILAEVHNIGQDTVLLAHPNVCFPYKLKEGLSFRPDQSQSYLSVEIEGPNGTNTVLWNNGLRMFDPGNRHSMTINPGQAAEFVLGWFGPEYSVGQWRITRPPFAGRGRYHITARLKNAYPIAYVLDQDGDQSASDAWIGELQSNTISLIVR